MAGRRPSSERLCARVRDEVFIATKFGGEAEKDPAFQGASRRSIMNSCEESLRRLQTDRIDLYYLHLPDPSTPIEETLDALTDLVRQGKVVHTGCSHLSGAEIAEAQDTAARKQLRRLRRQPKRVESSAPGDRTGRGSGVPALRPRQSSPISHWRRAC